MPLYEYICQACGHEFEEIQSFSAKPIRKCPACGKLKVEKKVSLTSFSLKGEGWYKDGYAKPSDKKTPGADTAKSDSSKKESKSEKKSESKTKKTGS